MINEESHGLGRGCMNCLQFENALSDYLEGSRTSEQQAHLSSCSACSSLLADLNLISAEAFSLRELNEPNPKIWNAIEAQLRREGLIRRPSRPLLPDFFRRWRSAWLVPVAAALVIAAGIKLYHPAKIGDNQPVAMPKQSQPIAKHLFPVRLHLRANSSSEQTATLPHLPEAIRAYASATSSRPNRWVIMSAGCRFQRTKRSTNSSISHVVVTHEP